MSEPSITLHKTDVIEYFVVILLLLLLVVGLETLKLQYCRLRLRKITLIVGYLNIYLRYLRCVIRLRVLQTIIKQRQYSLKAIQRALMGIALLLESRNRFLVRTGLCLDWFLHKCFPSFYSRYLTPNIEIEDGKSSFVNQPDKHAGNVRHLPKLPRR